MSTMQAAPSMQAWICEKPLGFEHLAWASMPVPVPAPGEVVIEVKAASLNFPDLLIMEHKYQRKPKLPFVPGSEFVGVVLSRGASVTHLELGDTVACLSGTGGFGTHAVVPADRCFAIPSSMPSVDAAAFVMTYATSHHALMDRAALRAGETVLVLGAAGGVGSAAIQVAKAAGARVVAAASTDEKCAVCAALGADATINYGRHATPQAFRDAVNAATDGRGPDVVYDPVGGALAEPAFRSLHWRGRYLVVGFAGGDIPSLPFNLALLKGASLVGVFWGEYSRREPAHNARMLAELADWYARGLLKPLVHRVLPMSGLKDACVLMNSRAVHGKLVLVNANGDHPPESLGT